MFFPAETDALSPLTRFVEPTDVPKVKTVPFSLFSGPAVTGMAIDYGQPFEGLRIRNMAGGLVVDEGWTNWGED